MSHWLRAPIWLLVVLLASCSDLNKSSKESADQEADAPSAVADGTAAVPPRADTAAEADTCDLARQLGLARDTLLELDSTRLFLRFSAIALDDSERQRLLANDTLVRLEPDDRVDLCRTLRLGNYADFQDDYNLRTEPIRIGVTAMMSMVDSANAAIRRVREARTVPGAVAGPSADEVAQKLSPIVSRRLFRTLLPWLVFLALLGTAGGAGLAWRIRRRFQRLAAMIDSGAKSTQISTFKAEVLRDINSVKSEVLRSRELAKNQEEKDEENKKKDEKEEVKKFTSPPFLKQIDDSIATESLRVELGAHGEIEASPSGYCTIKWIDGQQSQAQLNVNEDAVLGSSHRSGIDAAFVRIGEVALPDGMYRTSKPAIYRWDPVSKRGWMVHKGELEKLE